MKKWIRDWLVRTGLYKKIKYSKAFAAYEKLAKPELRQMQEREVAFYRSFIQPCALIFDIGANDGHKTEAFLTIADRVVCVEPEPGNISTLQARFRNRRSRVIIEPVAVSDQSSPQKLFVHHEGSAFNTLSPKFREFSEQMGESLFRETIHYSAEQTVPAKTLDQLIEQYGQPGFIKVDTEGFEATVVRGLTRPVRWISLEFMLPHFQPELEESLSCLKQQFGDGLLFNIARDEDLLFDAPVTEEVVLTYVTHHCKGVIELIVHNPACQ